MMEAGRWALVQRVLKSALDRPPAERGAFVHTECGSDAALRAEVESLLAAHAAAGSFAEQPAIRRLGWPTDASSLSGHDGSRLEPGAHLGPYEVIALIGEGGMGEVWRARHTGLKRDDALKVLPDAFASDPDRLARFRREAQVLASLNHPNIAQVHGLEQSDGVQALVMELVEGPTLADRIARGPIPVHEALAIATQITEALEAAHEQGIIHRDLKPANIKLRPDGVVKGLDFGLAKALAPTAASVDATASPAISSPAMSTDLGVLLGTAAYMSPEQACGKAAHRRSDVWAFGCVLYEMLTGRRAFAGNDISDTLGNVLKIEPEWSRLPAEVPQRVRGVLRACLQKDPKERLGDVQSVRLALRGVFDSETLQGMRVMAPPMWRRALSWVAGILVGGVLVGLASRVVMLPTTPPVARFVVTTPDTAPFSPSPVNGTQNLAISPDGTRVIYRVSAGGRNHLYVRRVDQLEGVTLFSADADIGDPIVSPDNTWVAFASAMDRTWKKVLMLGGAAVTLFPAEIPTSGASWRPDDTIIFTGASGRLFRAPAAGGESTALTTLDTKGQLTAHRRPVVLPGGAAVLIAICRGCDGSQTSEIAVLNLATNELRILLSGGLSPRYAPTGHLVYGVAGGTLMAVPFDLERLQLAGTPVPVLEGVMTVGGAVEFDLSANGSLVYVAGPGSASPRRSLVWVDREGRETALNVPRRAYTSPRISPDGTKLALNLRDEQSDIWIWDFAREMLTRLTFDPGQDRFPVWSPDGRRIAFSSQRDGSPGTPFWQAADGTGAVERLAESSDRRQVFPTSFSPDATRLVVYGAHLDDSNNDDVGIVHLGDRRPVPLLETTFREVNPDLSPDGRWLAYESNESGRDEVYVRPFPDVEKGRWLVSTSGGNQPRWARNGRELFFRRGAALIAVPIETAPGFAAGNPAVLFEGSYATPQGGRSYDVSPDGQRFLMIKEDAATGDAQPRPQIILVQNWFEELKRLVPTN